MDPQDYSSGRNKHCRSIEGHELLRVVGYLASREAARAAICPTWLRVLGISRLIRDGIEGEGGCLNPNFTYKVYFSRHPRTLKHQQNLMMCGLETGH